jgi:hypothetical protein
MIAKSSSEVSWLVPNHNSDPIHHKYSITNRLGCDNRFCFLFFGLTLVVLLIIGMVPRFVPNLNENNNDLLRKQSRLRIRRWNFHSHNHSFPESVNGTDAHLKLGEDKDENGCIPSAGFIWCDSLHTCIQPWVVICPSL